jgi:hypothetical protein
MLLRTLRGGLPGDAHLPDRRRHRAAFEGSVHRLRLLLKLEFIRLNSNLMVPNIHPITLIS